jgi:hypothetical protein
MADKIITIPAPDVNTDMRFEIWRHGGEHDTRIFYDVDGMPQTARIADAQLTDWQRKVMTALLSSLTSAGKPDMGFATKEEADAEVAAAESAVVVI